MAVALVLRPFRGPRSLLNVSYDGSRDFYPELNEALARSDSAVTVEMSHAVSTRQARAIIRGLQADVVSLATAADIDAISRETDLIATDWRTRLPFRSSHYRSTIVLLVRAGNPRGIADWQDLARDEVKVVSPSPRISGAGRWAYLAAWGYSLRKTGGDQAAAERFGRRAAHLGKRRFMVLVGLLPVQICRSSFMADRCFTRSARV